VVLVNFEEHLRIIVLKENANDTILEGIVRLFKMIGIFEKLGYATDSYLGNLTVSPANIGTGLSLGCTLSLANTGINLDKETSTVLKYDSQVTYTKVDPTTHTLKTNKMLAPAYNEQIQIIEFLKNIKTVCNAIDESTK
jgi:protein-arginine kinase